MTNAETPTNLDTGVVAERSIDIGGYHLALYCAGQGTPIVVMDAGSGDGGSSWAGILPAIATFTQVCTFDRAGVGHSEMSPHPRTCAQIVQELHVMLRQADVNGPYILVGHSLGGLNMQLYAMSFPDQVAALVLVDPAFPEFLPMLKAQSSPEQWAYYTDMLAKPEINREGIPLTALEAASLEASQGTLPDVPIIVLSSDDFGDWFMWPSTMITRMFQDGHAALVARVRQGRHLIVEHSHHYIHDAQPAVVIDGIRKAVEMVRT